jgi:blocked-early-in-transport protein 1
MERRPGGRGGGTYGGAAYDNYLEHENDAQISNLASKVTALRDISIQIGGHVREDNRLLDDLDGGFDSTGNLLGGTMKRLGVLAKSGGGCHMTYLVAFVLFVFLLLWRMTK